ncbi:SMI1/KNR4 family protein [Lacihabitans soyangensis]|uniref:SMI1/KNR4 family protein n=1 Tax=Lacihabitans soyangensis TaxID=869394 RepID=A0AAE3H4P5_9BACT|nr:SMI1/KNR4 family protein [Lacihabitans soyangensis]MCP9762885.1 SMI1/KNR4 family protein [Lacihabitans soyangensis]
MNWIEIINGFENSEEKSFEFYNSVNSETILKFHRTFSFDLPNELKDLLNQTNGIGELLKINNKPSPIHIGFLIYQLEEIIEVNLNMRNNLDFQDLYMPFDCLFFISNAGNGDLFGYRVLNNKIKWNEIYCWNHETDERVMVANNLYDFLNRWIKGEIKV